MNFGMAIEALKEGKCVTRRGWNGKGMFLTYTPERIVNGKSFSNESAKIYYKNKDVKISGTISMKAADDTYVVGWLASQTDMLAEDWEVVTFGTLSDSPSKKFKNLLEYIYELDVNKRYRIDVEKSTAIITVQYKNLTNFDSTDEAYFKGILDSWKLFTKESWKYELNNNFIRLACWEDNSFFEDIAASIRETYNKMESSNGKNS